MSFCIEALARSRLQRGVGKDIVYGVPQSAPGHTGATGADGPGLLKQGAHRPEIVPRRRFGDRKWGGLR